jgi:hypothetical protein
MLYYTDFGDYENSLKGKFDREIAHGALQTLFDWDRGLGRQND